MTTPIYRIKISIYDDNTAEEVAHVDEPMMSQESQNPDARYDDNLPTYHRALRSFESGKSDFEATHYPDESDNG